MTEPHGGAPESGGTLEPLRPAETLSHRTTDVLRERILAGEFAMGERLVEASIARQLQISRGPVREALRQLRAEGLVREEPRRGAFVADLTIDDIREIYDLRAAIEARFLATLEPMELLVPFQDGGTLSELHELAGELERTDTVEGVRVKARVPAAAAPRFERFSLNGR